MKNLIFLAAFLTSSLGFANEFRIGDDLYAADQHVLVESRANNAFLAGQKVRLIRGATGSVHSAGEIVEIRGPVGGNIYSAGRSITLRGRVAGHVSLAGQIIELDRGTKIDKEIRAFGQEIILEGDIDGYALLVGQKIVFDGKIKGDVTATAGELVFGKNAKISGKLTYYADKPIKIPASVIDPSRVSFNQVSQPDAKPGWIAVFFLLALWFIPWLTVLLLALFALLATPRILQRVHGEGLKRPAYSILVGLGVNFAYWALIVLLALSVVGIPIAIALAFAFPLLALCGYFVGVYGITFATWHKIARVTPTGFWGKFGVFVLGFTILYVLGSIPLLGALFSFVVLLYGLGAITLTVSQSR